MVLAAAVPLYSAIEQLRTTTAEDPFLLLKLFNPGGQTLSVVAILGFVIPVMAIGLGFDAINGEHNRRTLSRILAQPIYRDALLAGKFLAGLIVLAVNLTCLWLLVVGLGVLLLGVPPSGEEFTRSLVFLVIAVAYAGVVACPGDAVFGAVPLAGDRRAAGARRLAVHDPAVADDRAVHRAD